MKGVHKKEIRYADTVILENPMVLALIFINQQ